MGSEHKAEQRHAAFEATTQAAGLPSFSEALVLSPNGSSKLFVLLRSSTALQSSYPGHVKHIQPNGRLLTQQTRQLMGCSRRGCL